MPDSTAAVVTDAVAVAAAALEDALVSNGAVIHLVCEFQIRQIIPDDLSSSPV